MFSPRPTGSGCRARLLLAAKLPLAFNQTFSYPLRLPKTGNCAIFRLSYIDDLSSGLLPRFMTSSQIRQSFLDFFKSKQHTIVPSSSLMPDSPNLLFTNAGMNQFVPIFLGQQKCPYNPPRAADTQKCIRAGGKHNDLDDVGLDTYHHTFFEMLGNWSFGDYFKKEAIDWAWELITEVWKFPKNRLYATVYSPDKSVGDPSDFDQEAYDFWAAKFTAAGLDPKVHIVYGNKKDNFWMMGETGPCGPCSELHVDLTPQGDTRGALVNKGSAECIEIWNLVFIQFNANPDGTFSPLPARHVDTGMGFERVTSILQCTKNFTDFTGIISNYETDIFRPIFDKLEKMSGKRYGSTLPPAGSTGDTEQEKIDVAFRVVADHIRTLSFAIADGIQPGNTDRNYVLRRILRRAVRYGRSLGFHEPFFYKLVDVLADTMGDVFPEIRARKQIVQDVIRTEEEAFNKTLDKGLEIFEKILRLQAQLQTSLESLASTRKQVLQMSNARNTIVSDETDSLITTLVSAAEKFSALMEAHDQDLYAKIVSSQEIERLKWARETRNRASSLMSRHAPQAERAKVRWDLAQEFLDATTSVDADVEENKHLRGRAAFLLYDTYGFPLDLTQLMVRERGKLIDIHEFNALMDLQRKRARAAQKNEVISLSEIQTTSPTRFVGFEQLQTTAKVLEVVSMKEKTAVILDVSSAYAEMGGQVGDTGELTGGGQLWRIVNTQKSGNTFLHFLAEKDAPAVGAEVQLSVDAPRRHAIQRHHTVTHLLHWALHEVVSKEAAQKGSFVGPDKLTFDFNAAALTPAQVGDIEKLVNERIVENAGVSWTEVPHAEVKGRKDVMQFFGDKYGDQVRVVQIGGKAGELNGYSMELCGGTHTRATGEIGLFRIVGESAVAAGVRRIEAVAGLEAYGKANEEIQLIKNIAGKVNAPIGELEKKIDSLLAQQKELEKQLKALNQKEAASTAKSLIAKAATLNGVPAIVENLGAADGDTLQSIADALKGQFKGVVVLGGASNGAVSLVASVSPEFTARVQAGKIIQTIAPIVGGKGGGKPDNARGGGKDVAKLDEALAKARGLLAG
jgi:alanyl-tRNA synthetase